MPTTRGAHCNYPKTTLPRYPAVLGSNGALIDYNYYLTIELLSIKCLRLITGKELTHLVVLTRDYNTVLQNVTTTRDQKHACLF